MTRTPASYAEQSHRLLTLVAYVRANPRCSAPNMAAAIGVSRNTLYRLLDVLRESFGLVIESKGGHYILTDAGVLDQQKLARRSAP